MSAPADPGIVAQVPFSLVEDFIRALGAEPEDVTGITMGPDGITLTTRRKDPTGKPFAAGRDVATATTQIGIKPRVKADAL